MLVRIGARSAGVSPVHSSSVVALGRCNGRQLPLMTLTTSCLLVYMQDQEQPLIFQAATSAVDPMSNEQCYAAVTRKEAQMPPRFKVFHGYPKPDMRDIYCRTRE